MQNFFLLKVFISNSIYTFKGGWQVAFEPKERKWAFFVRYTIEAIFEPQSNVEKSHEFPENRIKAFHRILLCSWPKNKKFSSWHRFWIQTHYPLPTGVLGFNLNKTDHYKSLTEPDANKSTKIMKYWNVKI